MNLRYKPGLVRRLVSIVVLACAQAIDLRALEGCNLRSRAMHAKVRTIVPFNDGDRRQERWKAEVGREVGRDKSGQRTGKRERAEAPLETAGQPWAAPVPDARLTARRLP